MEKITVSVQWCGGNFAASLSDNVPGAVVFTADTFEHLKREAEDTLRFHIDGMLRDGDEVPGWLREGDYELVYNLIDTVTVLKACEPYASLAAISRASGINQHQLSHYANGLKQPRMKQRQRIVDGLHLIGSQLLSVV